MNYVIFKDIDSRTLKGLIISELPPITKPKMRVQETIIDGVDGSIIEDLGYESYDKTITIGLSKDFDIDEIIEYFSGEGNIVFSNEPNKYYKAKIIEQIDYERLIRFRTATIKLRVQPFKYEYQEEEAILSEQEATGTEVKINDGKVLSISTEGRSTQDGTPTPDTPIEIQNIGTYNQSTNKYEIDINIKNETNTKSIKLELDEPLRSLPNGVKDIVKLENNRVSVSRFIGSVVLNGNEIFSNTNLGDGTDGKSLRFYISKSLTNCISSTELLCSHFKSGDTYGNDETAISLANKYFVIRINFEELNIRTNIELKNWLTNNPVEVLYELEYPETTITEDRTGKYTMAEGEITVSNSENASMVVSYLDDKIIAENKGNYVAKPIMKIKGSGYIELRVNDNTLFSYTFPDDEYEVVIDSQKQDAYLDTVLKNRNMSGEFPVFKKGENIITWNGTIENIEISSKSRWL